MVEYTYKDVIIDPTSEEAKNCIGKKVYMDNTPGACLRHANYSSDNYCRILREINDDANCPFISKSGYSYGCIILPKEEPKPEYVPFKSREEFLYYYAYHNDRLTESSLAHQISTFGGIFLKDNDYHMVTEILNDGVVIGSNHLATTWKDILDGYTFLDGTPCGIPNKTAIRSINASKTTTLLTSTSI